MVSFIRLSVVLLLAASSLNCTRTIEFRVFDAVTKKPISDVKVTLVSERLNLLEVHREVHRDVGRSSGSGSILIKGIPGDWRTAILFRKNGYYDLGCLYNDLCGEQIEVAARVPASVDTTGEILYFTPIEKGKVVTIKMFPAPSNDVNIHLNHNGDKNIKGWIAD